MLEDQLRNATSEQHFFCTNDHQIFPVFSDHKQKKELLWTHISWRNSSRLQVNVSMSTGLTAHWHFQFSSDVSSDWLFYSNKQVVFVTKEEFFCSKRLNFLSVWFGPWTPTPARAILCREEVSFLLLGILPGNPISLDSHSVSASRWPPHPPPPPSPPHPSPTLKHWISPLSRWHSVLFCPPFTHNSGAQVALLSAHRFTRMNARAVTGTHKA